MLKQALKKRLSSWQRLERRAFQSAVNPDACNQAELWLSPSRLSLSFGEEIKEKKKRKKKKMMKKRKKKKKTKKKKKKKKKKNKKKKKKKKKKKNKNRKKIEKKKKEKKKKRKRKRKRKRIRKRRRRGIQTRKRKRKRKRRIRRRKLTTRKGNKRRRQKEKRCVKPREPSMGYHFPHFFSIFYRPAFFTTPDYNVVRLHNHIIALAALYNFFPVFDFKISFKLSHRSLRS